MHPSSVLLQPSDGPAHVAQVYRCMLYPAGAAPPSARCGSAAPPALSMRTNAAPASMRPYFWRNVFSGSGSLTLPVDVSTSGGAPSRGLASALLWLDNEPEHALRRLDGDLDSRFGRPSPSARARAVVWHDGGLELDRRGPAISRNVDGEECVLGHKALSSA